MSDNINFPHWAIAKFWNYNMWTWCVLISPKEKHKKNYCYSFVNHLLIWRDINSTLLNEKSCPSIFQRADIFLSFLSIIHEKADIYIQLTWYRLYHMKKFVSYHFEVQVLISLTQKKRYLTLLWSVGKPCFQLLEMWV